VTISAGQFYALAAISSLAAAAATFIGLKMKLPVKILMRISAPCCLLLIPVTGALTGSFHSQELDIPWWIFGVVNAAMVFFSVLITLGICLLTAKPSGK
jgi:hypothetical protein